MRLIVKCLQCICCNGVCLLIISQQGIEAKFADDAKWFRSVRDSDMETRQNEGTRQRMWVWFLFWFSSFFLIQIKVISIERNCEVPCSTGLCSKWSDNSFSARSASYYRWSRRNLCLIPMKEKGFWLKKGQQEQGRILYECHISVLITPSLLIIFAVVVCQSSSKCSQWRKSIPHKEQQIWSPTRKYFQRLRKVNEDINKREQKLRGSWEIKECSSVLNKTALIQEREETGED